MTHEDQMAIYWLHKAADLTHDIDGRARLRQIADRIWDLASHEPPPPPPGSVAVQIAVIRYMSDGDDFVECDVIYDDIDEVMEALESHVIGSDITHKAIVSVALPRFTPVPTVAGEAVAFDPEATR